MTHRIKYLAPRDDEPELTKNSEASDDTKVEDDLLGVGRILASRQTPATEKNQGSS